MIPIVPKEWPPIIGNANVPRHILWRDRLFTAAGWLLLLWLCRRGLRGAWNTVWELLAYGHLDFPGRPDRWQILEPYFIAIGLLALWAALWGLVSLWRRRHYAKLPQPHPLALEEAASRVHCTAADLTAWRTFRICTVHLDQAGTPTVIPKA